MLEWKTSKIPFWNIFAQFNPLIHFNWIKIYNVWPWAILNQVFLAREQPFETFSLTRLGKCLFKYVKLLIRIFVTLLIEMHLYSNLHRYTFLFEWEQCINTEFVHYFYSKRNVSSTVITLMPINCKNSMLIRKERYQKWEITSDNIL